ncbi:hypothetical protein [Ruminiclostridium papyrosolvens]|uniref:Uncharacterized protein n=1 Tax=Ruminiclostridium papyrosolvens C7 TaxID=1330534 RepID=U4R339_9FIRM|nr:hypothetical protein [Ruminiclostridium papyrosolvens]EPR12019.1 hypothetical protein L323_09565 [Ruminiclostridium papyrosolvens C7]
MSGGKISKDEPLETLANILEAIIDIILYGCTCVKTEKLPVLQQPLIYHNFGGILPWIRYRL